MEDKGTPPVPDEHHNTQQKTLAVQARSKGREAGWRGGSDTRGEVWGGRICRLNVRTRREVGISEWLNMQEYIM